MGTISLDELLNESPNLSLGDGARVIEDHDTPGLQRSLWQGNELLVA